MTGVQGPVGAKSPPDAGWAIPKECYGLITTVMLQLDQE
jgi:hypothetical protein